MRILCLDSSAVCCSAAVFENGNILAESFVNVKITHSQTLLPMVESMLQNAQIPLSGIDLFGVSVGPGSFTGVRIGVAAVKGMAMALGKPCLPVSTLEAMAYGLPVFEETIVCAAMDARASQVYNGLFKKLPGKDGEGGTVFRETADRAISIADLAADLADYERPVVLVGDGAALCYNVLQEKINGLHLADVPVRFQRAAGVGYAALRGFSEGRAVPAEKLMPAYLRRPQAEREREQKTNNK